VSQAGVDAVSLVAGRDVCAHSIVERGLDHFCGQFGLGAEGDLLGHPRQQSSRGVLGPDPGS